VKILIVSDTHRINENLFRVMRLVGSADYLLHCGDVEGSEDEIFDAARGRFGTVKIVSGNNDFFSALPVEEEFRIGKYNIWMTHGHHYGVSMGHEKILEEAASRGDDIVIFGHTHSPVIKREGNIVLLNPGSLTHPRQAGRLPSFILMEIDRFGEAHYNIDFLRGNEIVQKPE
jgi:putative phosphoesterase